MILNCCMKELSPALRPIQVCDDARREADWKAVAIASVHKKQKLDSPKLPWEMPNVAHIFRTGDSLQGTFLEKFRDQLNPTCVGACDTLNSQAVRHRPESTLAVSAPPVVPLEISKARKESRDEDIRFVSLCNFVTCCFRIRLV